MYSKKTVEQFAALYTRYINYGNQRDLLNKRFERIERALERASTITPERQKQIAAAKLGRKDKMRSYEVPIIEEKVDTLHTKLVDKLLGGYPVFAMAGVKGNAESQRIANMYTALMEQDQERFGWDTELSDGLRSSTLFNLVAIELSWASQNRYMLSSNAGKERSTKAEAYSGVRLRNLDPYNFIFDPTVPLHELQSRGVYAGYIERHNYVSLHDMWLTQQDEFKLRDAMAKALTMPNNTPLYFIPELHPLDGEKSGSAQQTWSEFFDLGGGVDKQLASYGKYEVLTMYTRVIPAHFGIASAEAQKPAPFKLIYVSGELVYVEPLRYAFGGLPIFAAHLRSSARGFTVSSFAENLEDIQDAASSMLNGSINSMRRAVGDRALYNPLLIRAEDINSDNPVSKIPVRLHGFNTGFNNAYQSIPYRDDISQWLFQHMQLAGTMADSVTGVNRASQGNFTKGNRTMQEFDTIMDNSEGRLHKYALTLERRLFAPLKQAIKLTYMQFVSSQDITSRTLETTVQIDPIAMLRSEVVFKMADGMNSVARQMSTDVLVAALNTIAQSPMLAGRYDVAALFAELMLTQKVDISKYQLAQQPAQTAQTGAPNGQQPAA